MKKSSVNKFVTLGGVFCLVSTARADTSTNVLSFATDRAVFAGNGCASLDSSASSNGNTLTVLLNGMDSESAIPDAAELAGRLACSLRLHVLLKQDYYLSSVLIKGGYFIEKSMHSSGSFGLRLNFFTAPDQTLGQEFAHGQETKATIVINDEHDLQTLSGVFCSAGRTSDGILGLNLTVSFQKTTAQDVFVWKLDPAKGLELQFKTQPCVH